MASETKKRKAAADLHKAVQTNDVRVVDACIDRLKRDGLIEAAINHSLKGIAQFGFHGTILDHHLSFFNRSAEKQPGVYGDSDVVMSLVKAGANYWTKSEEPLSREPIVNMMPLLSREQLEDVIKDLKTKQPEVYKNLFSKGGIFNNRFFSTEARDVALTESVVKHVTDLKDNDFDIIYHVSRLGADTTKLLEDLEAKGAKVKEFRNYEYGICGRLNNIENANWVLSHFSKEQVANMVGRKYDDGNNLLHDYAEYANSASAPIIGAVLDMGGKEHINVPRQSGEVPLDLLKKNKLSREENNILAEVLTKNGAVAGLTYWQDLYDKNIDKVRSGEYKLEDLIKDHYTTVSATGNDMEEGVQKLFGAASLKELDTSTIPKLPACEHKGPPVKILVQEPANNQSYHNIKTLRTACATSMKLADMSLEEATKRAVAINMNHNDEAHTNLLYSHPQLAEGNNIMSISMAGREDKVLFAEQYTSLINQENTDFNKLPKVVIFQGVGNDGRKPDHWGDNIPLYNGPGVIKVGATNAKGTAVADYSENGPCFVAQPIQAKSDAKMPEFAGTSLATPYAATIYTELYSRYGQSKENPNGLSSEEVIWTMCQTADSNIGTDKDGFMNKDMPFSKKAGYGKLDPMAADKVAKEFAEFKQQKGLQTEGAQNYKYNYEFTGEKQAIDGGIDITKRSEEGYHITKIVIKEPVTVKNILVSTSFAQTSDEKGDLEHPEIYADGYARGSDGRIVPLKFSASGYSITQGFLGQTLPAGYEIEIATYAPQVPVQGDVQINGISAAKGPTPLQQFKEQMQQTDPKAKAKEPKKNENAMNGINLPDSIQALGACKLTELSDAYSQNYVGTQKTGPNMKI